MWSYNELYGHPRQIPFGSKHSALVGAMSLARAVSDEALSHEILKTVANLLKRPA
jgi:hypothetical protein